MDNYKEQLVPLVFFYKKETPYKKCDIPKKELYFTSSLYMNRKLMRKKFYKEITVL